MRLFRKDVRRIDETPGPLNPPSASRRTISTWPSASERTLWLEVGDALVLYAPFAEIGGDELPESFQGLDGGRYEVAALPPFAVLSVALPWTVEGSSLRAEALELTRQADAWRRHLTPSLLAG